jgi:hypothetical protein
MQSINAPSIPIEKAPSISVEKALSIPVGKAIKKVSPILAKKLTVYA